MEAMFVCFSAARKWKVISELANQHARKVYYSLVYILQT